MRMGYSDLPFPWVTIPGSSYLNVARTGFEPASLLLEREVDLPFSYRAVKVFDDLLSSLPSRCWALRVAVGTHKSQISDEIV